MLQIHLDIEPDEHGVFDGRDMAAQLIAQAYRLLVPYVDGCEACSDALFGSIANLVIEEAHEEARQSGGELPGGMYATGEAGDEKDARKAAHLHATQERTAELLGVELDHHHTR
jgi:hypothetical protein